MLTGRDILFKIGNFKKARIDIIQNAWSDIESALKCTVDVLVEMGFSGDNIVSYNAIVPIVYYI